MHDRPPNRIFKTAVIANALILASLGGLGPNTSPISAAPPAPGVTNIPWPIALHKQMARIGAVEFSLRRAAADLCPNRDAAIGIRIDVLQAYVGSDQALVSNLTGLGEKPQIIAVAPDSPAEHAGVRARDELISINGVMVSDLQNRSIHPELLADELEERIAATSEEAPVVLQVDRDGVHQTLQVQPLRLCSARFILKTGQGLVAYSDDHDVAISSKLVEFARNDDELAIFASHELAHIVARDDKAHNLKERRAMEDRADLLGVDLMRCAGYDPERGIDIWRRYVARDWLRWLRDSTHRKVPDRIADMTAHLATTAMKCPPQVPSLPAGN